MSWVMTLPEWMEMALEHLEKGNFTIEELLAHTWNNALESSAWAIHDADPRTYPGREHTVESGPEVNEAFRVAEEAVISADF